MAKLAVGAGVGSSGSAPQREKNRAAPSVTVRPTLQGPALIGATLRVNAGRWEGVPRPSFSTRWQRGGVDIPGATEPAYTPVAADDGAQLRCVVTASNALGTASAASGAVSVVHPTPVYTGGLLDQRYAKDAAIAPVDISPFFNGEDLVFKADDLPEGLRLDEGVISGVPRTLQASAVVISAANSGGEATGVFNVVVFEKAAVPEAFAEAQWSVASSGAAGEITIRLNALPADGGLGLARIEYRIDGGAWTDIGGTAAGDYAVSGLAPDVEASVALRAVNAIGAGPAGDVKTVTPGSAAPVYTGGLSARSWTEGAAIAPYATADAFSGSDLLFTASGLPAGLAIDAAGVISGAPAAAGTARVTVTAINSGGAAQGAFDVSVAAGPAAPVVVSPGAIAGTPRVGETLSVAGEIVTGTPSPAIARQWTRDGADIPGATAAAYALTAADDRAAVACRVSAANAAGSDSAVTAAVAVVRPSPTATGGLADRAFVQGSGPQTVDAAADFAVASDPGLASVVWSVSGAGATISAAGVVTIPTGIDRSATAVVVTAANSGGSASSAFDVTVAAPAQGGLTVSLARNAFGSDGDYKSAVAAAIDAAVAGSGAFSAARAGDTRRINLDGIVAAPFETGSDALKSGLEGRVEIVGSGLDTCKWHGAGHAIVGGTTARNVDLFIDGMELSLGDVGSQRPSDMIQQVFDLRGRWRRVELGADAGFNRYSFAVGGATNYDYSDIRQYFRKAVLTGVTSAEYAAITPMQTLISFGSHRTRVEAKADLGGGRVRLWINSSDAGEHSPKWNVSANALKAGDTVSWSGGSGTCESSVLGDGVPPSFSQTTNGAGADFRDFIYRGLIFNAGEVRVTAERVCEFSGVWDWLGNGDYWKQRANKLGKYPSVCRIRRAVARNSVPGRALSGAHSDVVQWFDNNASGTQNVLLEVEDVLFLLGAGMHLGQRPKVFGDWGSPAQVQLQPGSYIRNCFFDVGAVQSTIELLDGPLAIDRLCLVNSGISGHDGASVGDGVIRGYPGQSISNSIVGKINANDAFPSRVNTLEIGNATADDYRPYFPAYDAVSGVSVEALLAKFAPAPAYADKSPITPAGEFVAANGETLWTTSGAPGASTQKPVRRAQIPDQSFAQGSGDVTIDLDAYFSSATSYAVSGSDAASVVGRSLVISGGSELAVTPITVTATNANGAAADTLNIEVTATDPSAADMVLTPVAHDGDYVGHRAGVTDSVTPETLFGVQVDRLRARANGVHQLIFAGSAQPNGYTSITLRIGAETIALPWSSGQYRATGQDAAFYEYLLANAGKNLDVIVTGA